MLILFRVTCTHSIQVKTVLKARATAWEPVKRWFLKDVFNLPNKKRKFIFNEFEHFWTWSRLQLFIWGGEEFVSAVKTDEYERVRLDVPCLHVHILQLTLTLHANFHERSMFLFVAVSQERAEQFERSIICAN